MPHAWWSPHLGSALRELPHYAPVANGAIEVITFTRSLRDSLLGNVCQYQRQYELLISMLRLKLTCLIKNPDARQGDPDSLWGDGRMDPDSVLGGEEHLNTVLGGAM